MRLVTASTIGNKWDPNPRHKEKHPRDIVWLVSEIDSKLAERIAEGDQIDGSVWKSSFTPDYFTINGVSGFETAAHDDLGDDDYAFAGSDRARGL